MRDDATDTVIESVFTNEWGRLLALLIAQFRRLDLAEDGLADAFESATRTWAVEGAPRSPAAWLLTAARRRVLDRLRAEAVAARKEPSSPSAVKRWTQQLVTRPTEPRAGTPGLPRPAP